MIKLNLVPEYIKNDQKLERILALNIRALLILCFGFFIASGVILYAQLSLQDAYDDFTAQSNLIADNSKDYNNKVATLNNRISVVSKIKLENFDWPAFLEHFSQNIPPNIIVNSASFNHVNDFISLSVIAKTREDLLALRTNLVASGIISSFEFPVSIMLQKENIKFEINSQAIFSLPQAPVASSSTTTTAVITASTSPEIITASTTIKKKTTKSKKNSPKNATTTSNILTAPEASSTNGIK
ncbi:MAG: hypothetical protein WCG01_02925 [bacterium]